MPSLSQPTIASSTPQAVPNSVRETYVTPASRAIAEVGRVLDTAKGSTQFVSPGGQTQGVGLADIVSPQILRTNLAQVGKVNVEIEASEAGVSPTVYSWIRIYLSEEAQAMGCCSTLAPGPRLQVGEACPVGWESSLLFICDTYGSSYDILECTLRNQETEDPITATACT